MDATKRSTLMRRNDSSDYPIKRQPQTQPISWPEQAQAACQADNHRPNTSLDLSSDCFS